MIKLQDKKDCVGCHACSNVCPKQCISMQADEQGFLYPVVDTRLCVDCGLCEKVCPVINQSEEQKPIKVYAAKNKNQEVRLKSSSGGVFTSLAEYVLNNGGVVFGAKFNNDWNVVHSWTDTKEGLAAFRGSKYVQSTIGNTYREAKEFLTQGRKVLFSGTPCQIAGLKKYLRADYDNLLAVEVVCHGTPSPKVWNDYLKFRCSDKCGNDIPKISDISFRDKTNGWKQFGFKLSYSWTNLEKTNVELAPFKEDIYMKGFLRNIYLRPSCYSCPARKGKSKADISLGDYWGIEKFHPQFDDDKGCGLVLINTSVGERYFEQIEVNKIESKYEDALKGNRVLEHSVPLTKYSKMFWDNPSIANIDVICKKMKPNILKRVLAKIYRLLIKK